MGIGKQEEAADRRGWRESTGPRGTCGRRIPSHPPAAGTEPSPSDTCFVLVQTYQTACSLLLIYKWQYKRMSLLQLAKKTHTLPCYQRLPRGEFYSAELLYKRGRNLAAEVWSCHNAEPPTTHQEFMSSGFPAGWPKLPPLALRAGHIVRDELLLPFAFSLFCSLFSSSSLCCCSVPLTTHSSPLCSSALPLLISPCPLAPLWHFGAWLPQCFSGNPACFLLLPRFAPKPSYMYAWRKAGFHTPPSSLQ